jgi:hypothetical protein
VFAQTCIQVREAIYGINCSSFFGQNQSQVNVSNGTGFMISPGIIATVAHQYLRQNDLKK